MQWFRFYGEALDDPKVQRLPGDLFKTWVNLLCLANRTDRDGALPSPEDCAFALRLDLATFTAHVGELIERGLIDAAGDDLAPHNWEGRQKRSDNVTARVQRHREHKKQSETLPERSGNALDKTRIEKTRAEKTRVESVTPPAAGARAAAREQAAPSIAVVTPVPKPKDAPARANPHWDALVSGIGVAPTTSQERSRYGKVVRELRDLGATPDDILARCANYRARWPEMDLTPEALVNHWSRMEHPPPPRAGPNGNGREAERDEQTRANIRAVTDLWRNSR